MSDEIDYSKKGDRKLSQFIAHEMLYDFVLQDLDEERRQAVENFISENKDAKMDLNRILRGREYALALADTKVSQELVERIQKPSSYLQALLDQIKFDEWPVGIRLGLEAIFVAAVITGIALVIPWHKIMHLRSSKSSEVVLAEIERQQAHNQQDRSLEASAESVDTFPDEGFSDEAAPKQVSAGAAVTTSTMPATTTSTTVKLAAAAPIRVTTTTTTTTAKVEVAERAEPSTRQTIGYLYRGTMRLTNIGANSPKITEALVKLGGRKAGEVELGWRRGSGAYYHFTIPEARLEEVKAVFGEYGSLNLNRERHERVMPEGIIRLIITVEEAK